MRRSIPTLALALIIGACGGKDTTTVPTPVDPESAIQGFMGAVQAQDLRRMANLWGTSKGPASKTMEGEELRRRLSVMQVYLAHDSFEILPPIVGTSDGGKRDFVVRIVRKGCTPSVPFTMVRYGEGWLVNSVDLAAAGNPARECPRVRQPSTTGRDTIP